MPSRPDIILAFSGGLDTSFCVPWLLERGFRVVTLFVDTGGVSPGERAYIECRASELGADEHITQDASQELWESFVVPFVQSGSTYQDQYPLRCSDRYLIAKHMTDLAHERGAGYVAHGCTAAGNDQFRFDQSVRSLGDFEIVAPIRAIQSETDALRPYEEQYLRDRGFDVRAKTSKYTINENCLGVTISGSEIDGYGAPSDETYGITRPAREWPEETLQVRIGFDRGVPVRLDGKPVPGPTLLAKLNSMFGAYGVGRGMYTGDTTIGIKGRIVFEAPGLQTLMTAHQALEQAVLTKHQNAFKPIVSKRWVELVYEGFFFDPLRGDLEAMIGSTQQYVTGEVTVATTGGVCHAVAIDSPHILQRPDAMYAQSASWTSQEAEGFIKLYGQSSVMARSRVASAQGQNASEALLCQP
ncbi:MAG: argininosuccinate synthase [Planctomycetota bacterium]|jgi:argininosuccinate synthase